MYNLEQVVSGINKYLEQEFLAKINGWQKWLIGVGFGMAMNNANQIFNEIKEHPVAKMLNVVDEQGNINVEALHEELLKQARKSPVTFNLPMLGNVTLNESDVQKLYSDIVGM